MTKNPEYRKEVEEKSGQNKSPTLDIDGVIVPDAGIEEVVEALSHLYKNRVSVVNETKSVDNRVGKNNERSRICHTS